MARAGVASRRESETMIAEGRVTVNGEVVTELGTKATPGKDHVKVDGKMIGAEERKVYFLFHKPGGVITAASDPHGRPVVLDYVKVRERIFPVGRLDWDTEGLLLLTNDGDLAYRLTHPSFQVPRTYHAKVRGIPDEKVMNRLRRGVRLDDGKAFVENVRSVGTTGKNTWIEVIVTEGRNRLVRRLLEAVGHPVQKLKRTAYGGLTLGALKPGMSRVLTKDEVGKLLRKDADTEPQAPARGRGPSARFDEDERPSRPPTTFGRPDKVKRVASDSEDESSESNDDDESGDE